ncbi:amino acid permease [Pseudoclavibacter sp. RFBB5]|uniref:amino acid permease n=1 Tax=Pseudoclavibacter sp. RFBB5 TaxID=2080574 RepID=UPI00215743CE|nr:amino acid permease [Pseudoclavibacter sp. RFBB5]
MGASGFVLGFQMGIFSFIGVELVGTAAAETENPRKTLPKAINSIVARILIFYVGALIVIMSVTPWDKIEPGKSPFVSTLAIAGFGLAAFASTSRQGVPTKAVFFTCVFLFSAIPLLFAGDEVIAAFTFVSSMCATLILFTWGSIVVSYIVYLRRYPEKHRASKFKMPLARVAPWLVLAFFVFIAGTLIYGEDTRLPFLAAPVWFLILTVLWQLQKRKLQREGRPLTAPIPTIAHPLDEDE